MPARDAQARDSLGDRRVPEPIGTASRDSRPLLSYLFVVGIVCALSCWVFSSVLFQDRNFTYRDAGHFYYPLLKHVHDQWEQGEWPLWNARENSGAPLLGNPAASVLYPVRILLFHLLPLSYAAAFKWYVIVHVWLASATCFLLARHWKQTILASGMAAITFSFGATILFQYCNVIFLVGASWIPLGLLGWDKLLQQRKLSYIFLVGPVLALQVLGGDPQTAYLTAVAGAGYLLLLEPRAAIVALFGLSALHLPRSSVSGLSLLVAALILSQVPALQTSKHLRTRLVLLGSASLVGLALSAVQILPSLEFGGLSSRAVPNSAHNPYIFWVGPWRFIEFIWPNISGYQFPQNSRWLEAFPFENRVWVPSLYQGLLPIVLALGSLAIRRGELWRRWLTWMLLISLLGALGPAGGPSWYKDCLAKGYLWARADWRPDFVIGSPFEFPNVPGGLYQVLVEVLPAFAQFRFPAKLLTFAALAIALLAASGWTRLRQPRLKTWIGCGAASLVLAGISYLLHEKLAEGFSSAPLHLTANTYGPLQSELAATGISLALLASGVLCFGYLLLFMLARKTPWALWLLLGMVALDIGLSNKWMISAERQSDVDRIPKLIPMINQAHSTTKPDQPFRIHRMSIWSPERWYFESSPNRPTEVYRWEKDTVQPKYGIDHLYYAINEGTLEPYDYWWFFSPFLSNVNRARGIVVYPRRGFDLWGVEYFVLPAAVVPNDQNRGVQSLLLDTEVVVRDEAEDYQIVRNNNYYPRSWIVHELLPIKPIVGMKKSDRSGIMREILYPGFSKTGGLWIEEDLKVRDLRKIAWIEHPNEAVALSKVEPLVEGAEEFSRVTLLNSNRVELVAKLASKGVLVVAETNFPGWEASVDGQPAEILRVNRMMRGVALGPGEHQVVFQYNPWTFRFGGWISALSLILCTITLIVRRLIRVT